MTVLKVQNLSKKYDKRTVKGISNISLSLSKNQKLFILGPSGSGKSTLLDIIAGSFSADSGDINTIGQQHICKLDTQLSEGIELTVFNFLLESISNEHGREENENLIRSNLAYFELTNEINQPVKELSTGQKQRLCLVKLFNNNPTIALFDEPFSNIDFSLREQVLKEIDHYLNDQNIASIWVTHDVNFVYANAHQVLLLNHGVVVSQGALDELYYKPPNIFTAKSLAQATPIVCKLGHNFTTQLYSRTVTLPPLYSDIELSKDIVVFIRPEQVKVAIDGKFKATVLSQAFQGHYWKCNLKIEDHIVTCYNSEKLAASVSVNLDQNLHWIDDIL